MSYNQNVQDIQDELTNAERRIVDIREGYVCDLETNIESALGAVSDAEDQLRYVSDDLDELEEYREIGDLDEIQELEAEIERLQDDLAISESNYVAVVDRNLKVEAQLACQRRVIAALVNHFKEVNSASSVYTLECLMVKAANTVQIEDQS